MPDPTPTPSNNTEPALTAAGIAAVAISAVVFVVSRLNREWDILNPVEFGDFKTWLAAAMPVVIAFFIRSRVTPNRKVEERAQQVEAMVYAKAVEHADAQNNAAVGQARESGLEGVTAKLAELQEAQQAMAAQLAKPRLRLKPLAAKKRS